MIDGEGEERKRRKRKVRLRKKREWIVHPYLQGALLVFEKEMTRDDRRQEIKKMATKTS